jgi:hypothetical protein
MRDRVHRIVRVITVLPAVAIVAVGLSPSAADAGIDRARTGCGPEWEIVASPSPGTIGNALGRVIALSPADAWAVGTKVSNPGDVFTVNSLALHWNGTEWTEFPTPDRFKAGLGGLYALSSNDIWAVGSKFIDEFETLPLVEHYDGSAWRVVRSPRIDLGDLFDVDGTSGSDIWAVGTVRGPVKMLVEHYDGTGWTTMRVPKIDSDYIQLGAVDAISSTDVWGAGYYLDRTTGAYRNLVVHYDGTAWRLVDVPNIGDGDNQLFDLAAVNATNVWAVGHAYRDGRFRTVAMQFTGGSWRVHRTPNSGPGDNALTGVAAGVNGTMRAVGNGTNDNMVDRTLTEYYRDSAWVVVKSPNAGKEENDLSSVAISPQGDVWAVGGYNPHGAGKTLIEHLCP